MATLALAGLANAVGLPLAAGLNLGALAGSVIDSTLLFPALFGPPKQVGPKLNDLHISPNYEGAPIFRLYGSLRVPCPLVWQSPMKEIEDAESGGGKGGSGGEYITYKYKRSLALLGPAHKVSRCKRIWADGKIFYDEAPDIIYTSTAIAATLDIVYGWSTGSQIIINQLVLTNSNGTVDLSRFKAGGEIEVSGFTTPATANNSSNSPTKTWRIVSSKRSGVNPLITEVKVEHPSFQFSDYPFVAKAAGDNITLKQQVPLFKAVQVKAIRFYYGESAQETDPLMDKWVVDEQGNKLNPTYKNRSLIVLEDVLLTDFGNRVPNFEAEWEEVEQPLLADVYRRMLIEAGYGEDEFDVSGVTGTMRGYAIRGPQPTGQMLQPLALAYDLLGRSTGERLILYDRKSAPVVPVSAIHLGAHEIGSEPFNPFLIEPEEDELAQPSRYEVQFLNPLKDYQTGMRQAINPTAIYEHVDSSRFELALTPEEGSALAQKLLAMKRARNQRITLQLPHVYMDKITEGIVLSIPDVLDEDWSLLVESYSIGANFMIECVCRPEDPEVLEQEGVADESEPIDAMLSPGGGQDEGGIHVPSVPIAAHVIEVPSLRDADAQSLVAYVAPYALEQRYGWRGAMLFESFDDSTWNMRQVLKDQATVGTVATAPTIVVDPGYWDTLNTIRVVLYQRETRIHPARGLESREDDPVLNGANRIAVLTSAGWEIIGFAQATLVTSDPPTYDLTRLLRGLRNTEGAMAGHAVGNPVVLLTGPGIHIVPLNQASVGATRFWKLVAPGQDLNLARTLPVKASGASIAPMSPVGIAGTRDTSNNLKLTWHPRSRAIAQAADTRKPSFEERDMFDIDFLTAAGSTVLRTKSVERPIGGWTTLPTVQYEAAEQTADGITPGNQVKVRVYGVSARVGRGKVAEKVV